MRTKFDDESVFPAPVYKETVLAPLFAGVKRRYWRHQIAVNRASAVMLCERGWLSRADAAGILGALDRIVAETDMAELDYTGEHEDFYFYVEAELIRRLGADTAGRLHTGRSRNDIDHTVFKMALKERIAAFAALLLDLIAACLGAAERGKATLVVAYTHGQPAQPTVFGHYLGALVELLLRDFDRLTHAAGHADRCSMGAAAIATSGFGLDRARMAELLGFAAVQENSYGAIAAIDYATGVYSALRLLFVHLGRFVQDLNAWTGFEIGHLYAPNAFVQVSSIMPQKRNPVAIEHLRLLLSLGAARADAVIQAVHNTPFTDMNDSEGEVQEAGYAAFETGARALSLLAAFVAAIRVDEARVRSHIEESGICATELADTLVRREGLAFRQAHEIAGRVVRAMAESGATFATAPFAIFAETFAATVGRRPQIAEPEFREATTPEHFVAVRDMPGGPAPAALATSLAGYGAGLESGRAWLAAYRGRAEAAASRLAAAAAAIAG